MPWSHPCTGAPIVSARPKHLGLRRPPVVDTVGMSPRPWTAPGATGPAGRRAAVAVLLVGTGVGPGRPGVSPPCRQREERLDRTRRPGRSRSLACWATTRTLQAAHLPLEGLEKVDRSEFNAFAAASSCGTATRAPGHRLANGGHRRRPGRLRGSGPQGRSRPSRSRRAPSGVLRHPVQLPADPSSRDRCLADQAPAVA